MAISATKFLAEFSSKIRRLQHTLNTSREDMQPEEVEKTLAAIRATEIEAAAYQHFVDMSEFCREAVMDFASWR